jgi:hypothetical protein
VANLIIFILKIGEKYLKIIIFAYFLLLSEKNHQVAKKYRHKFYILNLIKMKIINFLFLKNPPHFSGN